MIRVDVMQAWRAAADHALAEIGAVHDSGFTSGATEYSFIVETEKTPTEVQDLLFETGMNWVKVRDWPLSE